MTPNELLTLDDIAALRGFAKLIRDAALEASALACEARSSTFVRYPAVMPHYANCASAIRALTEREGGD